MNVCRLSFNWILRFIGHRLRFFFLSLNSISFIDSLHWMCKCRKSTLMFTSNYVIWWNHARMCNVIVVAIKKRLISYEYFVHCVPAAVRLRCTIESTENKFSFFTPHRTWMPMSLNRMIHDFRLPMRLCNFAYLSSTNTHAHLFDLLISILAIVSKDAFELTTNSNDICVKFQNCQYARVPVKVVSNEFRRLQKSR